MKFDIEKRQRKFDIHYPDDEFKIAREFARRLYKEFGDFLRSLILFGSVTQKKDLSREADIDILVVIDDVRVRFTRELTQTYRIITEKVLADLEGGERLHVQSMKLTSFWEYVRAGDPVAINILRYGIALIDTGLFDPLQALLDEGRIRPSQEAVFTYFTMAPASVHRAKHHLLSAITDLYWGTIDAAHAALMSLGYIPPTPEHVAEMLNDKLVKPGLLKPRYAHIMARNYKIFKQIIHRDIKEVEGRDYDRLRADTVDFINTMRTLIEKQPSK